MKSTPFRRLKWRTLGPQWILGLWEDMAAGMLALRKLRSDLAKIKRGGGGEGVKFPDICHNVKNSTVSVQSTSTCRILTFSSRNRSIPSLCKWKVHRPFLRIWSKLEAPAKRNMVGQASMPLCAVNVLLSSSCVRQTRKESSDRHVCLTDAPASQTRVLLLPPLPPPQTISVPPRSTLSAETNSSCSRP